MTRGDLGVLPWLLIGVTAGMLLGAVIVGWGPFFGAPDADPGDVSTVDVGGNNLRVIDHKVGTVCYITGSGEVDCLPIDETRLSAPANGSGA